MNRVPFNGYTTKNTRFFPFSISLYRKRKKKVKNRKIEKIGGSPWMYQDVVT